MPNLKTDTCLSEPSVCTGDGDKAFKICLWIKKKMNDHIAMLDCFQLFPNVPKIARLWESCSNSREWHCLAWGTHLCRTIWIFHSVLSLVQVAFNMQSYDSTQEAFAHKTWLLRDWGLRKVIGVQSRQMGILKLESLDLQTYLRAWLDTCKQLGAKGDLGRPWPTPHFI